MYFFSYFLNLVPPNGFSFRRFEQSLSCIFVRIFRIPVSNGVSFCVLEGGNSKYCFCIFRIPVVIGLNFCVFQEGTRDTFFLFFHTPVPKYGVGFFVLFDSQFLDCQVSSFPISTNSLLLTWFCVPNGLLGIFFCNRGR